MFIKSVGGQTEQVHVIQYLFITSGMLVRVMEYMEGEYYCAVWEGWLWDILLDFLCLFTSYPFSK